MLRFFYTRHDFYARTEIFVNPDFFEFYVDRKKTTNPKRPRPENKMTTTLEKAVKNGWAVRKSGVIVTSSRQLRTDDVIYHERQSKRLEEMKSAIFTAFESVDKESLTSDWLKETIRLFNHPELVQSEKKTLAVISELYIKKRQTSEGDAKMQRVLVRSVARYEGFVRSTDRNRRGFSFDVDTVTRQNIEDFGDYLRHEKQLAETYPTIFSELLKNYPASVRGKRPHNQIEERGENTKIKMLKRLKALFRFANEEGYTMNRPFDGVTFGATKMGTPVYISIAERNEISDCDMEAAWEKLDDDEKKKIRLPLKTLIVQRDIFIFQCLVGCRIGDLYRMTESHVQGGMLVYTPHKTKDNEHAMQARVPLHPKALELIKKYKGVDRQGRLFPFISEAQYNKSIKTVFRLANVTRNVEIRNTKTGENELVPIDTVASSHLARRTFVGNAYFKVADPNLIGRMSGHVEGSTAFRRYRRIEDEQLKNVIDLIG